jgi:hypothetical protein
MFHENSSQIINIYSIGGQIQVACPIQLFIIKQYNMFKVINMISVSEDCLVESEWFLTKPVLVVEEDGVPGQNHRPWASNW